MSKWVCSVDATWEFEVEAEDAAHAEDLALDYVQGDYGFAIKPDAVSIGAEEAL